MMAPGRRSRSPPTTPGTSASWVRSNSGGWPAREDRHLWLAGRGHRRSQRHRRQRLPPGHGRPARGRARSLPGRHARAGARLLHAPTPRPGSASCTPCRTGTPGPTSTSATSSAATAGPAIQRDVHEYIALWVRRIAGEAAVPREDWDRYWAWLEQERIACPADRDEFDRHFTSSNRPTPCPAPAFGSHGAGRWPPPSAATRRRFSARSARRSTPRSLRLGHRRSQNGELGPTARAAVRSCGLEAPTPSGSSMRSVTPIAAKRVTQWRSDARRAAAAMVTFRRLPDYLGGPRRRGPPAFRSAFAGRLAPARGEHRRARWTIGGLCDFSRRFAGPLARAGGCIVAAVPSLAQTGLCSGGEMGLRAADDFIASSSVGLWTSPERGRSRSRRGDGRADFGVRGFPTDRVARVARPCPFGLDPRSGRVARRRRPSL